MFLAKSSVVEAAFIVLHYSSLLPYLDYMATRVYIYKMHMYNMCCPHVSSVWRGGDDFVSHEGWTGQRQTITKQR